jgi:serine phosphatase RsbU (regulator of sigma subunit)
MLPAATGVPAAVGSAAIYMGWKSLEFLADDIHIGPVPLKPFDIGAFLFLLAIGLVMFFRFTKVSREQARAAAELEAAREIQQRLVPAQLPVLQGWKIEAAYLPANEVGGDFYQVLGEARGPAWVVVGDVSGKGLRAAMTGTLAIGALRALAPEGNGPAELLSRLNDRLAESADGGFITCLCARLTPDGVLTLANAGHLPPYRNGVELELDTALPLGIVPRLTYTESQFQLEEGDVLTLLSDGVVEAQNRAGDLFGFERTREMVLGTAGSLAVAARDFGQTDDITVLSLLRSKVSEDQAVGAVPMYGTSSPI